VSSMQGLEEQRTSLDGASDLLVDATGSRCPLFDNCGFRQVSVLKSAQALGVVCHLKNEQTKSEAQLHESNCARGSIASKSSVLSVDRRLLAVRFALLRNDVRGRLTHSFRGNTISLGGDVGAALRPGQHRYSRARALCP